MHHFFKSEPHEYTEIGLFILFENNGLFWAKKGICKFIEKCMGFFFKYFILVQSKIQVGRMESQIKLQKSILAALYCKIYNILSDFSVPNIEHFW